MAVEKRVRFNSRWLPWLLVAPQLAIILVFFFWPAGQALYQSVLREDVFGTSSEFVGLENFRTLLDDESYLASFRVTAVFSFWVATLGLLMSLLLAVMADRVIKPRAGTRRCWSCPTRWRLRWPACCGCSCSRLRWAWSATRWAGSAWNGTTCSTARTP
jgi:ABC-type sugar transport system permease subunit